MFVTKMSDSCAFQSDLGQHRFGLGSYDTEMLLVLPSHLPIHIFPSTPSHPHLPTHTHTHSLQWTSLVMLQRTQYIREVSSPPLLW